MWVESMGIIGGIYLIGYKLVDLDKYLVFMNEKFGLIFYFIIVNKCSF